MRSQWDLHPEWGCLAPSRGFIRTARAVVLATVFGGIVGGSFIDWIGHPATAPSVAARTLVNTRVEPRPARSTSQDYVVTLSTSPRGQILHPAKILRLMKPRRN
jgi:hypothetical protein